MTQQVLYVNSERGRDDQDGRSPNQPLKTLTAALQLSQGDTLVHLQAGQYSAETGERFPLVVPSGCQVMGEAQGPRPVVTIQGGGAVQHPLLGRQSVTCRVQDEAQLRQLTIMNPAPQGIGIWLEAGRATLENVFAMQCLQYGGVALDQALPILRNCGFEQCGQAGFACLTQSKGHFERVFCQGNEIGLLMRNSAAPYVSECGLERNQIGLAIAGTAYPVLRQNRIRNNQTYGLQLTERGQADLGHPYDQGGNVVRHNGQADIVNRTERSLISCGNDVIPQQLQGAVELVASQLPDPAAVPTPLLDRPASFPTPDASAGATPQPSQPPATPSPSEAPAPSSRHFSDLNNYWAAPFIDGLAGAGAVAGFEDGTFRPQQTVTRAQFAALVSASFPEQPAHRAPARFSDVPPSFWGYEALTQAHRQGFLTGFPDGTMRPNQPITRIQAIVALTNGLGLSGGRVDDIGIYRDRVQVPSYAVETLATATRQRLVVNHPEVLTLRPLESIMRGEVAAIIYQGRVAQGLSRAIASPFIVEPDSTQPLFSDLDGHWAAEFIRGLAHINLVSGLQDGRFAPDEPISRAQFAAMVVNAFEPPPVKPPTEFRDVPADHWAANAIQAAYRGDFMAGFPDQTFAPENALVRVQTWVALVNGLGWEEANVNLQPLGQFDDYTTVPRYALTQAAIALKQHLIANYPNPQQLRPNKVATRAEVCVAVYQALVALKRLPAISSDYVL